MVEFLYNWIAGLIGDNVPLEALVIPTISGIRLVAL